MPFNSLSELAISESGFVFDTRSGATFSVNSTGLFVLNSMREGKEAKTIVQSLRERFEETPTDAMDHLLDFVRMLRQFNLVESEDRFVNGASVPSPAKSVPAPAPAPAKERA